MLEISENNGIEEISFATPTQAEALWRLFIIVMSYEG